MSIYRYELLLLSAAFFWGSSFVLVRDALQHFPVYLFLFLRFSTAILFFLIYLKFKGYPSALLRQQVLPGFVTGTVLFAGFSLQTTGLLFTSAANSAFITGLNLIFVPLLGAMLFKIRLTGRTAFYLPVAFSGFILLSYTPGLTVNTGDLLTLLCAVTIALQILLVDRYLRKYHNPISLVFGQLFWVAVWSLLFSLPEVTATTSPDSLNSFFFQQGNSGSAAAAIFAVLFTGIFCSTWGFIAQTIAQQHVPAVRVAVIFIMEPVFGALLDWMKTGIPGSRQLAGAAAILLALAIAEYKPHRKQPLRGRNS